jgi:uncharacterized protein (DUF952 family)
VIFHITSETELGEARRSGAYTPKAFAADGFIHCSHSWQVAAVANRLFRGRAGLVLLEIDPARLTCRVVEENLEGGSERFPHIYGALPFEAIAAVHQLPCGADGEFAWPRRSQEPRP